MHRRSIEPELYPRPDGTVYVCGEPASLPVPPDGPSAVSLEPKSLHVLQVCVCVDVGWCLIAELNANKCSDMLTSSKAAAIGRHASGADLVLPSLQGLACVW